MGRERILILGAAGRDFHNFNMVYRHDNSVEVVGFTAAQIPDIAGRVYPPGLAGPLYPEGIPIYPEEDLPRLVKELDVNRVIFAYSDLSHEDVMHLASTALAAGADFSLLGPRSTMLKSATPVIAVCAVRTGAGKSQTSRYIVERLHAQGRKVVAMRHPMPYGDLMGQRVQRFGSYDDLDRHRCTIEEREEYEPYIEHGAVVYAGVDYAAILEEVEKEADVIIWDGGNNDFSFMEADLYITVADPHRPGHETGYHPGETNLRLADVVIINKVDSASAEAVAQLKETITRVNPGAEIILAPSPISLEGEGDGEGIGGTPALAGRRVLVVEDGPTLTHGGMASGAGLIAARQGGAAAIVDPRPWAEGSIARAFQEHSHIGPVLPALGYSEQQLRDLQATIDACPADTVLAATPIDLGRLIKTDKPMLRVRYAMDDGAGEQLGRFVDGMLADFK